METFSCLWKWHYMLLLFVITSDHIIILLAMNHDYHMRLGLGRERYRKWKINYCSPFLQCFLENILELFSESG